MSVLGIGPIPTDQDKEGAVPVYFVQYLLPPRYAATDVLFVPEDLLTAEEAA